MQNCNKNYAVIDIGTLKVKFLVASPLSSGELRDMKEMLPLNYREREKRFSLGQGYMWGIDKAFLNIVTLAEYFQSPYIIPSNANIAWGLVYEIIEE